jgi:hypothetical protein
MTQRKIRVPRVFHPAPTQANHHDLKVTTKDENLEQAAWVFLKEMMVGGAHPLGCLRQSMVFAES